MLNSFDKAKIIAEELFSTAFSFLSVLNPQLLKQRIYKSNLDRLKRLQSTAEIEKAAFVFQYRGDYYWRKNSIVAGNKSGWYYALAAHYFEQIKQYDRSGHLFHFAGHQFRRWEALEKGMRFYFLSADILFTHCSEDAALLNMAQRSARRAIGMSKDSGDEEILKNWMEKKAHFAHFINQFHDQKPWD